MRIADINDIVETMIQDRIEEIGKEIIMADVQYQDFQNQAIKMFEELHAVVPDDHVELLFELEKIYSAQETLAQSIVYRQGIKDGIIL